jgi:hypothetical protein
MNSPRRHLGSELPAFSDRLGSDNKLPSSCLAFSHGRAALTWYIQRYQIKSVLICAYSCPPVVAMLERLGIAISRYDIGEDVQLVRSRARKIDLTIIPALFGGKPILDPDLFKFRLIDAAQTAFGYLDYPVPVLACPRKTTSLPDGAILRLPRGEPRISQLSIARTAIALKTTARVLWHSGNTELAQHYNTLAEAAWPLEPCRMSPESVLNLQQMDMEWYAERRKQNYAVLFRRLRDITHHLVIGTPYCYPILVDKRDEVLDVLHYERIYANRLWWNAEFDRNQFPNSAKYVDQLICLPVDQRHNESDMHRIADIVLSVAFN